MRREPDVPVAMRAAPRWLLWRSIPQSDPAKKPRKVPYYASGRVRAGTLDAPDDVAQLATFEEAKAALGRADFAGLGFALGPDETGQCWQGIDLDHLATHPELQNVADKLPGYTETSPSGCGVHAIGYGRPFASLGSNSTGIEAYAAGRFFTFTGQEAEGAPTCIAAFVEQRLAPLHGERSPVVSKAANDAGEPPSATVAADLRGALAHLRSDDRDLWIRMGLALKGLGDTGRCLWLEWSQTSEKYDAADAARVWDSFQPTATDLKAVFAQAQRQGWFNPAAGRHKREGYTGARPGPDSATEGALNRRSIPGVELTDFHAYMPMHSYIFAPSGESWPAQSVNSRIPPIPLLDDDGRPQLNDKGKVKVQSAASWLDQNRPVEQMTWCPGLGAVIAGRLVSDGGWIERPGCSVFNLYRPSAPLSGDATQADRWVEHVGLVYPSDADHIVKWLAHRVQRPHEKINHALVLGGNQGIGKDSLLEPVKTAIGPWNFSEVSPQQMLGRFNGFTRSVILRVSEARDLGDVDRFSFYDHLKSYTAAPPDVLRVDEKFQREYSVFNVCGVVITSNNKSDGIYLPADDRRHYVAWSPLTREEFGVDYFAGLYRWYADGGTGHVAAYLSALDLSAFDPKAPPPKTPAFWDIVAANRAPEDAELADALDNLRRPDAVTIEDIASAAASIEFGGWLRDRKNSRKIPHRLEEAGYGATRSQHAKDGLFKVSGRRCAIYTKKELSTRDAIAAAHQRAALPQSV